MYTPAILMDKLISVLNGGPLGLMLVATLGGVVASTTSTLSLTMLLVFALALVPLFLVISVLVMMLLRSANSPQFVGEALAVAGVALVWSRFDQGLLAPVVASGALWCFLMYQSRRALGMAEAPRK